MLIETLCKVARKATSWEKVFAAKWFIGRIYTWYGPQDANRHLTKEEIRMVNTYEKMLSLIREIQIKVTGPTEEPCLACSIPAPPSVKTLRVWQCQVLLGMQSNGPYTPLMGVQPGCRARLETIWHQITPDAYSQEFHSWVYALEQWFSTQTDIRII